MKNIKKDSLTEIYFSKQANWTTFVKSFTHQ